MSSRKLVVIEKLYEHFKAGRIPSGIVTSEMLRAAMQETGSTLGRANQANFLKDIIRTDKANDNWPEALKNDGITARQRYGGKRVLQFRKYDEGQTEPFPDRIFFTSETPVYSAQSASISSVARQLGRGDETWLIQVAVNLRLIETHLSIFSPVRNELKDLTHLQVGLKGKSEIDATFLVSYEDVTNGVSYFLITCEAKQLGERILEDQIREQVAVAMESNKKLATPTMAGVKPMAIKVVKTVFNGRSEKMILVVEFDGISESDFNDSWSPPQKGIETEDNSERLYKMPLTVASMALYRVMPPIGGLNLIKKLKPKPKAALRRGIPPDKRAKEDKEIG